MIGAMALIAGTGTAATAAAPVRKPAVKKLANPGVVQDASTGRWVVHGTGSWANHPVSESRTTDATGRYAKVVGRRLLAAEGIPSWMGSTNAQGKRDTSIWAPSVLRSASGTYVAYFAVTVKGAGSSRCIGTGTSTSAAGPFTASARAIACWKGSGASPVDKIAKEGKGFSLIDPTPVQLASETVLTYKTQRSFKRNGKLVWHTTTRLLRLDPNDPTRTVANPARAGGGSIKITDATSRYIEENPVMVQRDGTFTLFTSFGWYGTCNYVTRYHQSTSLWDKNSWLQAKHRTVPFPKKLNTCGRGNAQVIGTGGDTWAIYFNGHANRATTKGGPKNLYVGAVRWKSGKPVVRSVRS